MKNLLLILAVTSFAFAGAIQKEQPKKTTAKKTTTTKKSPTPAKKNNATAKKSTTPAKKGNTTAKKDTEKKSASTTKKNASNQGSPTPTTRADSNKKTIPANQNAKPKPSTAKAKPKSGPTRKDDKGDLDKAFTIEDPDRKIAALTKFLSDHPKSILRPRALESLTAARIAFGDANLEAGDPEYGLKLIREAMREAPVPYPEKLFVEVISKVPASLYSRGQPAAAIEAAAAIEKNVASSAPQLLTLADFYLTTENGDEAKRLAEAVIKLDEKSVAGYQTLGIANRLNFDLEASAEAFAKSLEIAPESIDARRNLADMKRALGKANEALALYAEVLAKDPGDLNSETGRILSLFESGKKSDAELELSRSLEANGANFILLAGAAWWYVSNGDTAKAIDLAGRAFAAEPRYIWSHIALARAFLVEGRLDDAEQAMLRAKKYGNFATLEYELASVRFANGFYREAADELQKSFSIKNGMVSTKLGRRIERSDKSFPELLAYERRASILLPTGADNAEDAERMKALLELRTLLAETAPDPAKAADLADAFAKGVDRMRYHRQIFAANALLERRISPAKALELSRLAVSGVDEGLNIRSASGPIMASELYASRNVAIAADRYVVVPDVPKQILSAIARGRIEEIAGWSLMEQGTHAEAVVRLRRAVSILPEKSAWWRSSMWRLGMALEADGKDKEAIEIYVKGYKDADPDAAKYTAIEAIFKRVNGGTEGLETLVGINPAKPAAKMTAVPSTPTAKPNKETDAELIEEKPLIKVEPPKSDPKVEEKTAASRKLTEQVTQIPKSVPVETRKNTDASPVEEKSVEIIKKTDAVPVEEKPVEIIKKPDAVPVEGKPTEIVKKTEAPPVDEKQVEKNELPPPVSKLEEKQTELNKLREKPTEIPTPSETPKKTDLQKVNDIPIARDDVPPVVTKVEEKVDDSREPPAKKTEKPLFEPVVIEVKRSGNPAKTTDKSGDSDDKGVARRTRVIENKEIAIKAPPPCTVTVSQENISLIADGGSIGVLVAVDGDVDLKLLAAAASSPKDIEVTRQPDIAGVSGRAYFVIKSLTNASGEYKITFAAPCGKKEVNVKAR